MKEKPTKLRDIEGEQLSAVSFVQDYVEFHFDGPVLRAFTHPSAFTQEGSFRFPEAGSRDALCSFVQDTVQSVEIQENSHISLRFSNGRKIDIPIHEEGCTLPEAFTFQVEPYNPEVLEVWNME